MKRSILFVMALLALLALVAAVTLQAGRGVRNVVEAPPRAPTSRRAVPRLAPAPPPDEAPPPVFLDDLDPRTPYEEALFAAAHYAGLAVVRCPLPPDTPTIGFDGLTWASVRDGVLVMAVDEVEGNRPLFAPVEGKELLAYRDWGAVGVAAWSGAEAGLLGDCVIGPVEEVAVDVRAVREDGLPAGGAQVLSSPPPQGPVAMDADGHVRIALWKSVHTLVSVSDLAAMESGQEWVRASEPTSVRVWLVPCGVADDNESKRMDVASEIARELAARDIEPLDAALEEPALSGAARAVLLRWREDAVRELEEELSALDETREAQVEREHMREQLLDLEAEVHALRERVGL